MPQVRRYRRCPRRRGGAPEHLVEGQPELAVRGHFVDDLALGIDVVDHLRRLDLLGIGGHHDDAILGILQRDPLVGLAELPAHVSHEVGWLDAVRLEGFVGRAEVTGQSLAERRYLDLKFLEQHGLDIEILAPRRALRELELFGRDHRAGHQPVVLGAHLHQRSLALAHRDRERLGEVRHAFFHHRQERLPGLGIDDLHDADQLLALVLEHRRDQHLLGAVAGLRVHRLQEVQLRAVRLQFRFVVDVADVDDALVQTRRSRRSTDR